MSAKGVLDDVQQGDGPARPKSPPSHRDLNASRDSVLDGHSAARAASDTPSGDTLHLDCTMSSVVSADAIVVPGGTVGPSAAAGGLVLGPVFPQ